MFTKGKWIITRASDSGHYAVQGEYDQFICELDPLPEDFANACLIAAAPELLEACKKFIEVAKWAREQGSKGNSKCYQYVIEDLSFNSCITKAIAKAENK